MATITSHHSRRTVGLSQIATLLSILACYGTLATIGILSLLGTTMVVHEGAWAGAIIAFAWLAVVGNWVGWRRHRVNSPLILAVIGAAMVSMVMFVFFNRIAEILGFSLLVAAAFWEWRFARKRIVYQVDTGAGV